MSTAKRGRKSKKPAVAPETQETTGHRGRAFGFYLSDEARERLDRHAEFLTQELGVPVSASKALERLLLRMISPEGRFQMP